MTIRYASLSVWEVIRQIGIPTPSLFFYTLGYSTCRYPGSHKNPKKNFGDVQLKEGELIRSKPLILALSILLIWTMTVAVRLHERGEEDRNRLEVEFQELENRNKNKIENLEKEIKDEKKRADSRVEQRLTKEKQTPEKSSYSLYEVEKWRPLVAKYFPADQVDNALLTMRLESGGNPNAVSATNDHGLFQVNYGLQNYGQQIYDPEFNISLAYNHFYKNRGWRPWYAVEGILWI